MPTTLPTSIDAGFLRPNGYAYLFSGGQYRRYAKTARVNGPYSNPESNYPRSIDVWNVPEGWETGIDAAFTDSGQERFFFFKDDEVLRYGNSVQPDRGFPVKISVLWPEMPEPFIHGIDAVFQHPNGWTYWFKGTQFVTLKATGEFRAPANIYDKWYNLPEIFQDGVDAAFNLGDGNFYWFKGEYYVRFSGSTFSADKGYPGKIYDWLHAPAMTPQNNAGFSSPGGRSYLFTGEMYQRYSSASLQMDRESYPHSLGIWNMPEGWETGIDAAFTVGNKYFFLKGGQVIEYTESDRSDAVSPSSPQSIRTVWHDLPSIFNEGVDATLQHPDGTTYWFKGNQYSALDTEGVDKFGEVKDISEGWTGLAAGFADGIDAAIRLEDDFFWFKGDEYLRFVGNTFEAEPGAKPIYDWYHPANQST